MTWFSWSSCLAVLTSVLLFRLSLASCPTRCDCTPNVKMECKRGPLVAIPQGTPGTRIIEIDGKGRTDINITYITETSFKNYSKLEELTIAYAHVKFIHRKAFAGMTGLLRIHLNNNLIGYLDEQIFSSVKFLTSLDLSNNNIRHVYRPMFAFPSLKVLSLENNGADLSDRQMFQNLSHLDVLDISGNDVGGVLPAAFNGVSTKYLRMNSCGVREVGPELIKMVKDGNQNGLELKNNIITDISQQSFSQLRKLKELYIDNNDLHTLDSAIFQKLQLRVLGLGSNNISVLKEDTFFDTSILHIRLSQNSISRIPANFFSAINGLKKIQLEGNPLKFIASDTFSSLQELDVLDLSDTQLHGFSLNAFSNLSIKFLDLSKNSLMTISTEALQQFDDVTLVDFSDNPWHCTCFIKPLKKWLLHSNYSQNCSFVIDPNMEITNLEKRPYKNCLSCTTPDTKANASVTNLTPKQLEQCYFLPEGALSLDQQVLICVSVTIFILVVGFVGYILFNRRSMLKYTLKGRTDLITNPGVDSKPASRLASKADLTDSVALEPARADPSVKLENISVISKHGFDPDTENNVNSTIYENSFTPKTPNAEGPKYANYKDCIWSLESSL